MSKSPRSSSKFISDAKALYSDSVIKKRESDQLSDVFECLIRVLSKKWDFSSSSIKFSSVFYLFVMINVVLIILNGDFF